MNSTEGEVPLFDIQAEFGNAKVGDPDVFSAAKLCRELEGAAISGALARIGPDNILLNDVALANELLYRACAEFTAIVPCPWLAPNDGRDLPDEEEQVADAIAHGAGAVWIRPNTDAWSLEQWHGGDLFAVLQNRRLPVLCMQSVIPLDAVARLAADWPQLPLIMGGVSYREYGRVRSILTKFENCYLSLGNPFAIHGAVEKLTAEVGAGRLLFGTGLPESEAMAAVTYLMYSDISVKDKAMIGHGSYEALQRGICK